MLLELLVLPAGGGGLLVGFLDNTEQASLKKSSVSASCLLTTHGPVRFTPPPTLPPNHLLLGVPNSSQL